MIMVTGADGFVGRHLTARLTQGGEHVRALVRNVSHARTVLPEHDVAVIEGDTTNYVTLAHALEDADVDTIVHCAFVTANRKQKTGAHYYQTNVLGTRNLVTAAKDAGVKRIVVMGGLGTKPGKPRSYMQGRYEADQAVRYSGLAYSILGPSVQFGSGSAFVTGLVDLIKSPLPFVPMIGSGQLRFQPIWVEDVVTCLLKMIHEPNRYDGRYLQVGGPEIYTYAQILDLLLQRLGKRKPKIPGPMPLVALGAAMMELALPNPPITRAALGLFDFDNVTALDAVAREFGFTPSSFRDYLTERGAE